MANDNRSNKAFEGSRHQSRCKRNIDITTIVVKRTVLSVVQDASVQNKASWIMREQCRCSGLPNAARSFSLPHGHYSIFGVSI